MCRCSAVIKALVFFTFSLHLSSAVKHSLQYIYTGVTPGINFPEFTAVGQLNGQQFDYYDSKIREMIPKTEWIEKNVGEDYWDKETWKMQDAQKTFKVTMDILTQCFNKTEGVHTWQRMYGCEFDDDDDTTRGYEQYAYDGEDYISFDLKTLTWITSTHQTVTTKYTWRGDTLNNNHVKNYLENVCIEWLKKYVFLYKETLKNKVVPEVSVFQKRSPYPEVVCQATGFFHKPLNISWQKNGEDVHVDVVELRETLPNQDGSFQRRSILKVSAEELQKHNYTCVVQHSSLEKELVLNVSECRILTGRARTSIFINIIIIIVAVVAFIAYCTRGQRRQIIQTFSRQSLGDEEMETTAAFHVD